MFIANDSNYSFGQFLAVVDGDDIKSPVYSKCFTDTETLKGYRFIHDPEETDPEKCVCFSIYSESTSAAAATAFGKGAAVSDLTSVLFRLDTAITGGVLRNVPYYHVIVPVVNINDDTMKYLVIKMTKEVELFPENYPYYELVDTFADAEPTSAESSVITPTGTIQITENDTYDVTNYASAEVNVSGGSSDFTTATVQLINSTGYELEAIVATTDSINDADMSCGITEISSVATAQEKTVVLYKGKALFMTMAAVNMAATGDIVVVTPPSGQLAAIISGTGTITISPLQD